MTLRELLAVNAIETAEEVKPPECFVDCIDDECVFYVIIRIVQRHNKLQLHFYNPTKLVKIFLKLSNTFLVNKKWRTECFRCHSFTEQAKTSFSAITTTCDVISKSDTLVVVLTRVEAALGQVCEVCR